LRQYLEQPARLEEVMDDDASRYSVRCGGKEYVVYAPDLNETEGQSWGRATHAFFAIVNDQLTASEYRFFAINGGNDLGGMFLTPAHARAAQETLPNRKDWPYLPPDEPPRDGEDH